MFHSLLPSEVLAIDKEAFGACEDKARTWTFADPVSRSHSLFGLYLASFSNSSLLVTI